MAAIEKRGDRYRVKVRIKGEEPRTRTFTRKTDALLWAKKVESDLGHGAYVPTTMCLPAGMAGRPVIIRLATGRAGGGGCGEVFSEFGYWDDVTVGTDPACPP